jgi:hypothetical protein
MDTYARERERERESANKREEGKK